MKKGIIIFLIVAFLIVIGYFCYPYVYCLNKLDGGKVCTYGGEHSSTELFGNQDFFEYTFKRAIVSERGNTRQEKEKINGHEVVWLGNRDLVEIDGKLYQYFER